MNIHEVIKVLPGEKYIIVAAPGTKRQEFYELRRRFEEWLDKPDEPFLLVLSSVRFEREDDDDSTD